MKQPMATIQTTPRIQQPPRRRRRRVVMLLLLVGIGLGFGFYLFMWTTGGLRLENAIAEADRLDPGWRFDDLEAARRPYLPPDKDGMEQVQRIKAAKPKPWPDWPFPEAASDPARLTLLRTQMSESLESNQRNLTLLNAEQERVLRSELGRATEAIALARQLPAYPYGRFDIKWSKDFVSTLLPHVQNAREVTWLLCFDGLLRAHDNDIAGALNNVRASLYASRAVGDEEIVISQLVRLACDRTAVHLLEQSLACGRAPDDRLADLQRELLEEAQTPFFLIGIRGERACFDQLLERVQNGEIGFRAFRDILLNARFYGPVLGTRRPSNDLNFELETLRTYLSIRSERARQLHYLNSLVSYAKLPSWECLNLIEAETNKQAGEPSVVAALFCYSIKFQHLDLQTRAKLRTACTALALERFEMANKRWPATLAELTPKFLPEIPLDPFDGQPLRLATSDTGVVVYSVSLDKEDQHGTQLTDPLATGSDISFQLLDPAKRRQPGKPFPKVSSASATPPPAKMKR
ncbi:hypothetical protein BH10PLA2_BH10PLA2_18020 [soil metagenome]